jgi:hypothetical protein
MTFSASHPVFQEFPEMGLVFLLKGTPEQFKFLLTNKLGQAFAHQPATPNVGYGFNIENKNSHMVITTLTPAIGSYQRVRPLAGKCNDHLRFQFPASS